MVVFASTRRSGCPIAILSAVGLAFLGALSGRGDEGMWLFNQPPVAQLEKDHGVVLDSAWLLNLQRSSVRLSSGGSGAFVSADGLVLTNQHVAAGVLQKLGDEDHDYLRDGFLARSRAEELPCRDLEINVLESFEDVTARVEAAVERGMSADDAFAARRRVMAAIEQESLDSTGLRSEVVTLHQGGAYHLYRSKRYTDVRLVFAPERQIAFFGGDADNFEFPRFCLDVCFLRAYEDDRPARVPHHLTRAATSVAAGDLVFVSGHPGHTDRARTLAELVALRDQALPFELRILERLESLLGAYFAEGPEESRQAGQDLHSVENGRKRARGLLASLLDPRVVAGRQAAEAALRPAVEAGLGDKPSPYDRIAEAQRQLDRIAVRLRLLEGGAAFNSRFFANARTILRAADEAAKPSGERLREFRDTNRASLELQLFSPEPLYEAYEIVKLADSLTFLTTTLGPDDPLVAAVLAGSSPRVRAVELVRATALGRRAGGAATPDMRRDLYDGGAAAVAASSDAMLALARLVDPESRALRKQAEEAQEVKRQAHAEIARARFARDGAAAYPDATFTLRLAFGTVRGYEEDGREVAPITTFAGLFDRAAAKQDRPPFDLPPRWQEMRRQLEADRACGAVPLDFVSTADIVGGNSGSPVVNVDGELVGVIFDGNIQSLLLGIAYDDLQARAVAVDATGIRTALERVYGAGELVNEFAPRPTPPADQ